MVGTAGVVRAKRDVGRGAQSVGAVVVTLLQSSYDVRDYLRTCWRRIERNPPIIVYASVSNFSHSYTSHSFTLSRLVGLVEDEPLKLVGSLAFLCQLKTKISISFLLARFLSLIARINALQLLARIKDIWSDKEQRSLRKKLFVSRLRTEWMTVLGRPRWSVHYIRSHPWPNAVGTCVGRVGYDVQSLYG